MLRLHIYNQLLLAIIKESNYETMMNPHANQSRESDYLGEANPTREA
jgi:hypothetical protein